MILREAIHRFPGLLYIIDSLELMSAIGREMLLQTQLFLNISHLNHEYSILNETLNWVNNPNNRKYLQNIEFLLMKVHDVRNTLERLNKEVTLDDIDLFEIKSLAIITVRIKELLENSEYRVIIFPELKKVVQLLNPEKTEDPYFYIYDSYSEKLTDLRNKRKNIDPESEQSASLLEKIFSEEEKIRIKLSEDLRNYREELSESLFSLGRIDGLVAKAKLINKESLTCPILNKTENLEWSGLFNPFVKDCLKNNSMAFQPVNITVTTGVTLVSGANMGGKSVLLKSLALAQIMAQFGFFVPAEKAEIILVNDIFISSGDSQSETDGLSSFGAEVLKINEAVEMVRKDGRYLVLIDEPARTTNPDEGKMLVEALVEYFSGKNSFTVITTHYSGITTKRRLRVTGLSKADLPERGGLSIISAYMDYSLTEDLDENVPREALKVAEMLGFDEELLDLARKRQKNI